MVLAATRHINYPSKQSRWDLCFISNYKSCHENVVHPIPGLA